MSERNIAIADLKSKKKKRKKKETEIKERKNHKKSVNNVKSFIFYAMCYYQTL